MYCSCMVPPLEHPKKEVRKALKQARAAGWSVVRSRGRSSHAWGVVMCPSGACRLRLYGTPRVPEDLARWIRRKVLNCRCIPSGEEAT